MRCLYDFLFADDAAITAHTAEDVQRLLNHFNRAGTDFGLKISLKITRVMAQDADALLTSKSHHILEVVDDFTHLVSTITDSLSLNLN